MRENNNPQKRKCPWVEISRLVVTIIASIFVVLYLGIINNKIEKQNTAAEYIKIFADPNTPSVAKSLALSAMLKQELLDPVILLSAATRYEDFKQPGIMLDLLYEYGKTKKPSPYPIGSISLPGEKNGDNYILKGWAIDDKEIKNIVIYIDDKEIQIIDCKKVEKSERKDIQSILKNYKNSLNSGYTIKLSVPNEKLNTLVNLKIKIVDNDFHLSYILNADVIFDANEVHRHLTSSSQL